MTSTPVLSVSSSPYRQPSELQSGEALLEQVVPFAQSLGAFLLEPDFFGVLLG